MSAVVEGNRQAWHLAAAAANPVAPQSVPIGASAKAVGLSVPATSVLLPLKFMVAGIGALFLGVAAFVARPELLATYHYNQYVIAITHLLVLGWICTIVMGAMYQLVPVALETRLYSERLARWQFVCHTVGVGGMVWMFWKSDLKQVGHFGSVFALGVGIFVYNIFRTLLRVPRWNLIATAVTAALSWLSFAIVAGLAIAAGKCSYDSVDTLSASTATGALVHGLQATARWVTRFDQLGAMHAHAHLGTVGVYLMLIVGISYKLIPMFTLSEVQNRFRAGLSILLLNLALLASFLTILLRSPWKWVCALALVAAIGLYGFEIRSILRARKRRALDWGIKYFLTALAWLGVLCPLGLVLAWPRLPFTAFTGQLENLYGFLGIIGVISLAIIGMLYKIIPFLVWYRTYSRRIGREKVPSLSDLYSAFWQKVGYWTWLLGVLGNSVGIMVGNNPVVRFSSAMLAASLLTLGINLVTMLSHLFRPKVAPMVSKPALSDLESKPAA